MIVFVPGMCFTCLRVFLYVLYVFILMRFTWLMCSMYVHALSEEGCTIILPMLQLLRALHLPQQLQFWDKKNKKAKPTA